MKHDDNRLIIADAHAHMRRCCSVVRFVESAYANVRRIAHQYNCPEQYVGMLLLTEDSGEEGFGRLSRYFDRKPSNGRAASSGWRSYDTAEATALYLSPVNGGAGLIVVAGRQIRTKENLEVLALGTRCEFEANRAIDEVIAAVAQAGSVPVVPWGFGKWIGARREVVEKLVRDPELPPFFLGDSGNRPKLWPRPGVFEMAEDYGIRNLPGSDPLPLRTECNRPGDTGFIVRGSLDLHRPTESLTKILRSHSTEIETFHRRGSAIEILCKQFALRSRKLWKKWQ